MIMTSEASTGGSPFHSASFNVPGERVKAFIRNNKEETFPAEKQVLAGYVFLLKNIPATNKILSIWKR